MTKESLHRCDGPSWAAAALTSPTLIYAGLRSPGSSEHTPPGSLRSTITDVPMFLEGWPLLT